MTDTANRLRLPRARNGSKRPPGKGMLRLLQTASGLVATAMLAGCMATPPGPSPGAAPGYGYICYAGPYQCRQPTQVPSGTPCSCPGLGAPSYGRIH